MGGHIINLGMDVFIELVGAWVFKTTLEWGSVTKQVGGASPHVEVVCIYKHKGGWVSYNS